MERLLFPNHRLQCRLQTFRLPYVTRQTLPGRRERSDFGSSITMGVPVACGARTHLIRVHAEDNLCAGRDQGYGASSSQMTLRPSPAGNDRCSQRLAQASRRYHLKHVMIDALEKRMIEALKSVEAQGDVAPAHVYDPMTMLVREKAIQANLMRWDDARGRYVLTGTGAGDLAREVALLGQSYRSGSAASCGAVRRTGNPRTPTSRKTEGRFAILATRFFREGPAS